MAGKEEKVHPGKVFPHVAKGWQGEQSQFAAHRRSKQRKL